VAISEQLEQNAQLLADNPPETQEGRQLLEEVMIAEQQDRAVKATDNYNLVEDLDKGLVDDIGREVVRGYQADDASRNDWLEMQAKWVELYYQNEKSNSSADWASHDNIPILTEACNQFQSRTYKVFFANETFVSAKPVRNLNEENAKRAERIGRHMSFQLSVRNRDYKPNKDQLFLSAAIHGSVFTKTYHEHKTGRAIVENVRAQDFVVPYYTQAVDIAEVRRKTQIINTTTIACKQLFYEGYLINLPESYGMINLNEVQQAQDEAKGVVQAGDMNENVVLLEQEVWLDIDDKNEFRPYIVTVDQATGRVLRLTIGYEADINGRPLYGYEQIQRFTHYKFLDNPDGFYGLGLGFLLGKLNSSVNSIYRSSIDAAMLANEGNSSGYISNRLMLDQEEDVEFELGKFKKVNDTNGNLRDGIFPMQFPGPNQAMVALGQALDQRAQRLGATTEATTGSPESARQPTTYLAEVEQSLELFSSVQMRLAHSLTDELQKIYRINQRFLPLIDYFVVNGTEQQITRADYVNDMQVVPVFDPKFTTYQQKVMKAKAELDATLQNPNNQQRPQVIDYAFKKYLEAMGAENVDELIPPPQPPLRMDDQRQENMIFMMPAPDRLPIDVFPDQNHIEHLQLIDIMLATEGQNIPEDALPLIMAHRQKHLAFLYGQKNGVINAAPGDGFGQLPATPAGQVDAGLLRTAIQTLAEQPTG